MEMITMEVGLTRFAGLDLSIYHKVEVIGLFGAVLQFFVCYYGPSVDL